MRNSFKATRSAGTSRECFADDIQVIAECQTARNSGECVVDVWWSNEGGSKVALTSRRSECEFHSVNRELWIESGDFRACFHCVSKHSRSFCFEFVCYFHAIGIID